MRIPPWSETHLLYSWLFERIFLYVRNKYWFFPSSNQKYKSFLPPVVKKISIFRFANLEVSVEGFIDK